MLNSILDFIVYIIGIIGILIILIGVIRGFWMFIIRKTFWEIRLNLVKHILLGLDFLIARDIIETVTFTTTVNLINDLAILISIIIIRVTFSYFTSKEMNEIEGKHSLQKL